MATVSLLVGVRRDDPAKHELLEGTIVTALNNGPAHAAVPQAFEALKKDPKIRKKYSHLLAIVQNAVYGDLSLPDPGRGESATRDHAAVQAKRETDARYPANLREWNTADLKDYAVSELKIQLPEKIRKPELITLILSAEANSNPAAPDQPADESPTGETNDDDL